MKYSWESVRVDWIDEWKVWSVCGTDADGNSEYLCDAARKKDAINDALEYAFHSNKEPLSPRVDIFTKRGDKSKSYSIESANSEKRDKEYELVYVVEVKVVQKKTYVVQAKSSYDLHKQFNNGNHDWTEAKTEVCEHKIVNKRKMRRLKRNY